MSEKAPTTLHAFIRLNQIFLLPSNKVFLEPSFFEEQTAKNK